MVGAQEKRILGSWDEISRYMGRSARTVQRWEIQFGMPVHRPAAARRRQVFAYSTDLERWLSSTPNCRVVSLQTKITSGLRSLVVGSLNLKARLHTRRAPQK